MNLRAPCSSSWHANKASARKMPQPNWSPGELLALVEKANVDVICISVVAPSTVIHARYLCLKLRALLPKLKIVIGFWGATEDMTEATKRLRESGADEVTTTLAEALVRWRGSRHP